MKDLGPLRKPAGARYGDVLEDGHDVEPLTDEMLGGGEPEPDQEGLSDGVGHGGGVDRP
jgi:hypothetical protein